MAGLKDQSNDFNAQVFAATAGFLRYSVLNYLNKYEHFSTLGELFEYIPDGEAVITYGNRLREFFHGLFPVSFSAIFGIFKINEDFQHYLNALTDALSDFTPFSGR